jgi:RNA polymerase sigma-70 factor, ECF subfamily
VSDPFTAHRRLLFSIAYDLLGSVTDAEDVVQETWLRWSARDRPEVAEPRAYLTRIVSRLALNRLRAIRARRESYPGPWLPEPLLTTPDIGTEVAEHAERGREISLAMLVVLETLSPAERAVFVLREVFGLPHDEIATILGRSEAAIRQLAHRAREHVHARRPRFSADPGEHRQITERFLAACYSGDVRGLLELMAPDVILTSDGGGKARAARRPVAGADKVARFLVGITAAGLSTLDVRLTSFNGQLGVIVESEGKPTTAALVDVVDGLVHRVYIMANPDKLSGVALHGPSGRPASGRAASGQPGQS